MYVTRPISLYRRSPEAATRQAPEGPNSGFLVIIDEEWEAEATRCWGLCSDNHVRNLPFPQNTTLTVRYTQHTGDTVIIMDNKAVFIPVLGQPLSSNRYYVVLAEGKHQGKTCACSREEDMSTCCFCCNRVKDVEPRALNHMDMYQQVQIIPRGSSSFVAKSPSPDAFPPSFLRRKGWAVYASRPYKYPLGEAHGIDASLRARLPPFDFPITHKRSMVIQVGKWYCPFMFIKEMTSLQDQMKKTMFYEMHLEQCWEEIYQCMNNGNQRNEVVVNVTISKEYALLSHQESLQEERVAEDGMVWFRPLNHMEKGTGVGLSSVIVERMRWEAARGGWVDSGERDVKVEKMEVFGGGSGWKKFGCYMLVERFVLKRMDGSLVLTYDFRHTHKVQSKWE